jgi:O-antigen/teichoic acid export membrane protein
LGIIIRQSFKGTILIYIGLILGFITTGILYPRIYSTEQIGLLKIMIAYSTLIAMFGTLGINGVTIRLFPFFKNDKLKHNGYLSLILMVGLLGFLICTGFLLILKPLLLGTDSEKSALFIRYFPYLIILIFFQIFFSILDTYYSALLNSVHGTFLREVFQRVLIILFIGLYFFSILTFHQFVLLYLLALAVPTIYLLITLVQRQQFSLHTNFGFLDRQMVISIISVSAFSILNGFSSLIIQNVDIIMVNSIIDLETAGIYSICFFFGVVVSLPARSIYRIVNVVSAEAWKNNDMKTISDIYSKSCLTLFIIGLLLFLGIWVNIDNIFQIIGPEYIKGKWVIFFIGLGNIVDMATGANSSIFGTSKYYKIQTVFSIFLALLLVTSNLILIPKFGITGAAIGSAGSLIVLNILRYLFLYFKYKLQPYNIRFLYVILLGTTAFLAATSIPEFSNFIINIFVKSIVVTIAFCLPLYFLNISEDINNKVDEILRAVKLKI